MNRKRGKKASLSLSMNAIVIIILAVTMLGLGLTFMRTFMGKGTESLTEVFEGSELEKKASPLEPFTMDSTIKMKAGEDKTIRVGFYCDSVSDCDDFQLTVPATDGCVGSFTYLEVISPSIDQIKARNDIGIEAIISQASSGSSVCKFIINNAAGDHVAGQSKQVYVEVS